MHLKTKKYYVDEARQIMTGDYAKNNYMTLTNTDGNSEVDINDRKRPQFQYKVLLDISDEVTGIQTC